VGVGSIQRRWHGFCGFPLIRGIFFIKKGGVLYGELYVGMVFSWHKLLYVVELWLVKLYVGLYGGVCDGVYCGIVELVSQEYVSRYF